MRCIVTWGGGYLLNTMIAKWTERDEMNAKAMVRTDHRSLLNMFYIEKALQSLKYIFRWEHSVNNRALIFI